MRAALALAAVISLAGCEKSKPKIPDDPQPRPAALIATVAVPNASAFLPLQGVIAAVNKSAALAADPTIVTMTATSGVGAGSLEALDPDAPMYALWLDTGTIRGLAIVGKLKPDADDALAKLKPAESMDKNGWIVVAQSKEILALVAPYALTTVVATPPDHPTGTIYMPNVVARYSDKITAWRNSAIRYLSHGSPLDAAAAAGYVDGLVGAIHDTDEMRVVLEPDKDRASIDVTLVPKAQTRLAGFVAAQKPSDFSIAGKLPDKIAPTTVAGRLVLGPYLDPFVHWLTDLYGATFGKDLQAPYAAIIKAMTGELAVSTGLDGTAVVMYFVSALADQPAAETALSTVYPLFKTATPTPPTGKLAPPAGKTLPPAGKTGTTTVGAAKVTYTSAPDVKVDDVTVHVEETTVEKPLGPRFPGMTSTVRWAAAVAVFDNLLVVCGSNNQVADASRGIQVARGKAPGYVAPPELAAEITAAKNRHDSLVGAFDASAAGGKGVATATVGFADARIHVRVTVPTSVVRSLAP
jgi:hypothetical protein